MKPNKEPRFDGQISDTYIEVLAGISAIRHLRAALMTMAYALAKAPHMRGLVVMDGKRFSHARFESESEVLRRIFQPEIADRIAISIFEQDQLSDTPHWLASDLDAVRQLGGLVQAEMAVRQNRLPRPDYPYEIFKVLTLSWLRREGELAVKEMEGRVGCTYPTVAKVFDDMEGDLLRSSSRGVELAGFSKQRWASYLAQGDSVRQTFRFADRSGQPRAAEALIRRLDRLRLSPHQTPALGGVVGARGHFPGLDLLGLPRVDITLHCPDDRMDLGFVEKIDPGLKPCAEREAAPALVVHILRRKDSGFTSRQDGLPLADPVECLLDLHEARLETQAQEFLDYLVQKRPSSHS